MHFINENYKKCDIIIKLDKNMIRSGKKKKMRKRNKTLLIGLGVLLVIFAVLLSLNQFYIDYLWFVEMGYTEIFFKELVTKTQIGIPIFIGLVLVLFFYLKLLNRISAKYLGSVQKATKKQNIVAISVSGVVAFFLTILISDRLWYQILEFINQTQFNLTDPIFNQDLALYFLDCHYIRKFLLFLSVSLRSLSS
ncbi:UPF0182 family protein [Acetobacterium wieringae]|nr:UPF0182 family protein [Acetobacterium wieringae]URN83686.1 UPF0182 family protein [Acetobacterium wieringae]